jgi:hypothetical protein
MVAVQNPYLAFGNIAITNEPQELDTLYENIACAFCMKHCLYNNKGKHGDSAKS